MAQGAVVRDQTPLGVEKRRSNRTVYVLRTCCSDSLEVRLGPGWMAPSAVVRDYRL